MTFRRNPLFLTFVWLIAVSCNQEQKKELETVNKDNNIAVTDSLIPEVGSVSGDTINIHGKYVLFFVHEQDKEKLTAEGSQFCLRTGVLIDSLKKVSGIMGSCTRAGYFRIYSKNNNPMIITASALNTDAGVLVTDGSQPPKIIKGVLPDSDYHQLFKDYFFLSAAEQ